MHPVLKKNKYLQWTGNSVGDMGETIRDEVGQAMFGNRFIYLKTDILKK